MAQGISQQQAEFTVFSNKQKCVHSPVSLQIYADVVANQDMYTVIYTSVNSCY